MSEKRKVTMKDALAAGDGVIMTARRLRIEELEAENERLRAEGAKLNAALNIFFMRDPDKPYCWEYKREQAEEMARAALEPVEKVTAKGEE